MEELYNDLVFLEQNYKDYMEDIKVMINDIHINHTQSLECKINLINNQEIFDKKREAILKNINPIIYDKLLQIKSKYWIKNYGFGIEPIIMGNHTQYNVDSYYRLCKTTNRIVYIPEYYVKALRKYYEEQKNENR